MSTSPSKGVAFRKSETVSPRSPNCVEIKIQENEDDTLSDEIAAARRKLSLGESIGSHEKDEESENSEITASS